MSDKGKEKLVKFYHACKQKLDVKYIEKIIDSEGDINYQIVDGDCANSDYLGYTALHFAARCRSYNHILNLLIKHGADYTIKDRTGSTVLHLAFKFYNENEKSLWTLVYDAFFYFIGDRDIMDKQLEHSRPRDAFLIFNTILSAHIAYRNFENPSDINGMSHFHIAFITDNSQAVEFFLRHGVSIEQRINEDSPTFPGYTPLHLAVEFYSFKVFRLLLYYKANQRAKNAFGLSALHMLLERRTTDPRKKNKRQLNWFKEDSTINAKMIDALLKKYDDPNSVDDIGLSRLHIICTMSGKLTKNFLLNYEKDINHSVDKDAPLWAGYTALHFASYFDELAEAYFEACGSLPRPLKESVKLLLEKGANLFVQDAKGIIPLELLLRKYDFIEIFNEITRSDGKGIGEFIAMSDGKTALIFNITILINNIILLKGVLAKDIQYVNLFVPFDSPCWPGYSNLHLAVFFRNSIKGNDDQHIGCPPKPIKRHFYEVIVALLSNGADITHQDVKGITALNLAFRYKDDELVDLLLQYHRQSSNPIDFQNLSHLHIACVAGNGMVVERLLTARIDVNIPIFCSLNWPVKKEHCSNQSHCSEHCGLSIPINSTPLHVSVVRGYSKIVEMLMMHNANLYARDVYGMTPIHRLVTSCNPQQVGKVLLSATDLADSIVGNTGFSHLHVASFVGHVGAVEKLLDKGADVNASVTYDVADHKYDVATKRESHESDKDSSLLPLSFLSKYNSFTALDFAGPKLSFNMAQLLLRRGSILSDMIINQDIMHRMKLVEFSMFDLIESLSLQGQMKLQQGITILHIACFKLDFDMINRLLKLKLNVNTRVSHDSRLWPGFTSLHILIEKSKYLDELDKVENILHLLLENGADVTISNAQGETPLLMHKKSDSPIANLLLQYHRHFEINPVNKNGMSHFHVACLARKSEIVKEFLKRGINIDQPIDFFSDEMPGCTPLHLALPEFNKYQISDDPFSGFSFFPMLFILSQRRSGINLDQLEMVKALVQNGANVNAKDACGNTPVHYAAKNIDFRRIMYEHNNADFNIQNILAQTPFEMFLSNGVTVEEVQHFINRGFQFNLFNDLSGKGYIAMICKGNESADEIMKLLANNPNSVNIDASSRTSIHNLATLHFLKDSHLQPFLKQGCNIDHQDIKGRTALHVATEYLYGTTVTTLLNAGADMNVTDVNGNTPFAYITRSVTSSSKNSEVIYIFALHASKLSLTGLFLNKLDRRILTRCTIHKLYDTDDKFKLFCKQRQRTKHVKIDILSLYDFLSETGAVAAYPHMIHSRRLAVDEFFQSFDFTQFSEVEGLLKLQYNKALARRQLIEQAKASLIKVIGVELDEICVLTIFRYLSNQDLKNIFMSSEYL